MEGVVNQASEGTMNIKNEVRIWFEENFDPKYYDEDRLDYYNKFMDQGCDTLEVIKLMTLNGKLEQNLRKIGIEGVGHVLKFEAEINKLNQEMHSKNNNEITLQ